MKTKDQEHLENLLHTKNEHWNEFACRMRCEVVEKGLFSDAAQPMQLVDKGIDILVENDKSPAKAVDMFLAEITKAELNVSQQLFVYFWMNTYLKITEFEGKELMQAKQLLQSYANRLKKDCEPIKPLVKNIREMLKLQIQKELEQLPETLKDLEPEKRLNIVCKLIPFVLPKVESVHSENGETNNWTF